MEIFDASVPIQLVTGKFGLLMTVSLTDYVQGLEGLWLWLKVRVTVSCKVYG